MTNSGVCIKDGWYDSSEHDYYGILEDVVQLKYHGLHNKVMLFKCCWFDVPGGVRVDKNHGIVEVKCNTFLKNYEPFIFAAQVVQVYYLSYPSTKQERRNWWVAIKTRARTLPKFQLTEESDNSMPTVLDFFQEDGPCCQFIVDIEDDIPETLHDENIIEPLSAAEVEFILQQWANEISEIET
jgi:Domain of unknown function (DUF4216)